MFIDTYIDNIASASNLPILFYIKGASAEAYVLYNQAGTMQAIFFNGSAVTGSLNASSVLTSGRHKIAFGYKDNDFTLFLDGVQIATDTSGSASASLNEFGLNYYDNTHRNKQSTNATALWKTRLTNTQLAQLTTI
jgi:hypothetical protein